MQKLLLLTLLCPFFLAAQKLPSIEEKTKEFKKYEGFINFYWDENNGKIWLEVDKLETEILYYSTLPAGLGSNDIGLDRGLLDGERIVKFSRTGRKILLIQPNYNYRALSNDLAERRAVEQSFAQSALWGFTAEAETDNRVLVDATDFFLRDAIKVGSRLRSAQQGNYELDKSRSTIYLPRTKNFPLNSEFEATVSFINKDGSTGSFVNSVTPSSEAITLRIHHSFVQLPDDNYKPRIFDPRSGFIPISFYDYSTPVSQPIEKFYIMRHRLRKKDPSARISEAVKPIVYYLDNGTPEPIRSALMEGAGWWNQAFEAAGYKDAFQVKMLPEDADPMDVRYNVINWVHRSTRGWSYGASVTDPRTGEIIKGHVTLGSLRVRQDYLIAQGLLSPFKHGRLPDNDPMLKMALDRLKQLSAHEIGHTLGIMHNYTASVSNRASVMDYPHPQATLNDKGEIDLGNAYDNKIGEWDKVAIAFGYQDFPSGTDESVALKEILANGEKKGLQFISDQDARAAGGMHPQAHLWDNGSNATAELKRVLQVRAKALSDFGENNIFLNAPMAMLEDALVPVYFFHRYQLEAVTKIVGGIYYTYAVRDGRTVKTRVVTKEEQQQALDAIISCLDPKILELPQRITELIPPRPAGYNASRELFRKRTGLSFDALAPAETAVDLPLSFLFNPQRLSRMAQLEVQNSVLGAADMIEQLIQKTWRASRREGMQYLIQLQTEQVLLTYLLSASINDNNSYIVKAILQLKLSELREFIESQMKTTTNELYKGHLQLALERMKDPTAAKPTLHKEIPPGAPIGCDWDE